MAAIQTKEFGGYALKVEVSAFCDGIFSDHIPIKLYRIVHHIGKLADHQMQVGDARGSGLLCMAQGNFQDGLGDGKLVHLNQQFPFPQNGLGAGKDLWEHIGKGGA